MSGPEPGWEKCPGATNAFTRPLFGSELWFDKQMQLLDGSGQLAIGIQFTTTIHERDIEAVIKDAVVRLRFECPLVAATVERGIHHPHCTEGSSWVYTPLVTADAARAWADQTVHYLPYPADPPSFLQSTVEANKIPYILADGSEQYLRIYLTRSGTALNAYCLSLHATHSIIDAKPGLNALSLLLEWLTTPGLESVDNLAWGTEHKNLPPGPITVTGGPRKDWGTNGMALIQQFRSAGVNQTPSHGLHCDVSGYADKPSGSVHRCLVKFTSQESAKITQALKRLGFKYSELLGAACILAAFEQTPVPADKVETTYMNSNITVSLTDRLPRAVDRRKHLVSCLAFASYKLEYAPLATLPRGRSRLLAAMRQVKANYDWWLANPCLPHLLAALCPRIGPPEDVAPPADLYVPAVTNIGRVEDYVAPVWPRDGGDGGRTSERPVVRVDDMHMVVRMGRMSPPTVHTWSIQGRFSVLLQAPDGWYKDILQDYMNRIVGQICFVMDPE